MAGRLTVKLEGGREVRRALRALPPKVAANVLNQALLAGAAVIGAAIRQRAPVKRGVLRESVTSGTKIKSKRFGVVHVGPKAPHAHLVEFGHAIKKVKKGPVLGTVPPHPFVRPAWRASKDAAEITIREALGRGIEREATRVAVG